MPDMFEYEGPLDLTEYNVRETELRAETGDLIRVKVSYWMNWPHKLKIFLRL